MYVLAGCGLLCTRWLANPLTGLAPLGPLKKYTNYQKKYAKGGAKGAAKGSLLPSWAIWGKFGIFEFFPFYLRPKADRSWSDRRGCCCCCWGNNLKAGAYSMSFMFLEGGRGSHPILKS